MNKHLMNRLHELIVPRSDMSKPVLFITNDDGIDAPLKQPYYSGPKSPVFILKFELNK